MSAEISALEQVQTALGRYAEGMAGAMDAVQRSVAERQDQLEANERRLRVELADLRQRARDQDASDNADRDGRRELDTRRRRLEQKLEAVSQARHRLERAAAAYDPKQAAMQQQVQGQIPAACQWLEEKQRALAGYLAENQAGGATDVPASDGSGYSGQGSATRSEGGGLGSILSWVLSLALSLFVPPLFSFCLGPFAISSRGLGLSISMPLFGLDLGSLDLIFGPALSFDFLSRGTEPELGMGVDISPDDSPVPVTPLLV